MHHEAHAVLDRPLCEDEQGHADEAANVGLDVECERQGDGDTTRDEGERERNAPGQYDIEESAPHALLERRTKRGDTESLLQVRKPASVSEAPRLAQSRDGRR